MKKILCFSLLAMASVMPCGAAQSHASKTLDSAHTTDEQVEDRKFVVYQMMVRLFGNTSTHNQQNGSISENGVGKFNDINDKALSEIKKLGANYVWYTGVLAHASMADYSQFGIKMDDPDIVKGRAGSPYAVRDYYDVDPDLAVSVPNRMKEYQALIKRTHQHGLKMLMDFIPNHVARTYHSYAKPAGVEDFGANDDKTVTFSPKNDFYYVPGQSFVVPAASNAGGGNVADALKDGKFDESPAKATGNNVFSATPSIDDWYETVKLNYGVDYQTQRGHFDPVPPIWTKMRDILVYWAKKDVDGFRCDVAEMVPVEFWQWVIPQVKQVNPNIIFIAESYDAKSYQKYLTVGHFDYLYDKVGLYDALRRLITNDKHADVKDITHVWRQESKGFGSHMMRFLENHDEQRIASSQFAQNPWYAKPAMVVTATLSSGPAMIYFGQEIGEPAAGAEGFSGDDGRTTIFDYWGVPEFQKWSNGGAYDGAKLSADQRKLRAFYSRLLNATTKTPALRQGQFYELSEQPNFSNKNYAYLRYTDQQLVLVVANFDREQTLESQIQLPKFFADQLARKKTNRATNLLTGQQINLTHSEQGIAVTVPSTDALILAIQL